MNTLFFTVQNRRSLLTTRLVYGLEGMKYIIQIYEGEINGHGEKERLPEEFQYEFEQEMLKHIHELREKWWTQRDLPPEVHQPSFLRGDESDAQLGLKFEWERTLIRKTKSSVIYDRMKNVDAVRRLLGQSSMTATSAYLEISDESALDLVNKINIW